MHFRSLFCFFFFFLSTSTPAVKPYGHPLSLHAALPLSRPAAAVDRQQQVAAARLPGRVDRPVILVEDDPEALVGAARRRELHHLDAPGDIVEARAEEHTSELQ